MKRTFADLLSGGGGATMGALAAGLTPAWAVEHDDAIADCYERNLGKHVIRAKVQDVDYSKLPTVWLMHMSPVCTSFSVAKANGEETQLDIDIAQACARAIRENKPRNVSLENVRGYRQSKSFKIICDTLRDCGYKYRVCIINAADMGVPQTRIRLFVLASLDRLPRKPQPTHQKASNEQQGLFETRLPNWIGWYEAIEDLIPTLPESRFADWQMKRLPFELEQTAMLNRNQSERDDYLREQSEPSYAVCAEGSNGRTRAFIVEGSAAGVDNKFNMPVRSEGEPVFTMRGSQNNPRAFIVGGANTSEGQAAPGVGVSEADEPTRCVNGSNSNGWKAFIVDGQETVPSKDGRAASTRNEVEPYLTVSATTYKGMPKAFIIQGSNGSGAAPHSIESPAPTVGDVNRGIGNAPRARLSSGRVVSMTPRALARFMGFPDWYELPQKNALACKILGNACCPPVMQKIFESFE